MGPCGAVTTDTPALLATPMPSRAPPGRPVTSGVYPRSRSSARYVVLQVQEECSPVELEPVFYGPLRSGGRYTSSVRPGGDI